MPKVFVAVRSVSFGEGVGGLERAVSDQCNWLAALGWDVVLVTASPMRDDVQKMRLPIEVVSVPWPRVASNRGGAGFGLAYRMWIVRLAAKLDEISRDGDVLYLHGGCAGAIGRMSRKHRIVVNPHGMEEFASGGLLRWTNRAFTRRLTKRAVDADAVIATDENMVDSVIANIGVARERVCVVPNAVDSERLISLANQHPLKTHSGVLIVSVGRMVYNKGYDVLASALYELAISGRLPAGTVWRHFGSGPMARDIMEAVRKSGAFEYEQVPGAPDAEVQGYLSVADVFVQPSRYEGSSLTTLEAMCHGTVVVGTRTGGIPDKVVDGCTGFLAQPGDSDSLASAIGRALASDRQIVGRSAQERVTEMFDAKVAAKQLSIVLANSHA